jgi:K+ transporter
VAKLKEDRVPRVPGTAVFLTRAMHDTPPLLAWHVRHNRALQEHVLIITTQIESVPWIADEKRATVAEEAPGFGVPASVTDSWSGRILRACWGSLRSTAAPSISPT